MSVVVTKEVNSHFYSLHTLASILTLVLILFFSLEFAFVLALLLKICFLSCPKMLPLPIAMAGTTDFQPTCSPLQQEEQVQVIDQYYLEKKTASPSQTLEQLLAAVPPHIKNLGPLKTPGKLLRIIPFYNSRPRLLLKAQKPEYYAKI